MFDTEVFSFSLLPFPHYRAFDQRGTGCNSDTAFFGMHGMVNTGVECSRTPASRDAVWTRPQDITLSDIFTKK